MKNGSNPTISYTYDSLGNITEIHEGGTLVASYEYDDLNQLIYALDTKAKKIYDYTYDAGGNITRLRMQSYTTDPVNPTVPMYVSIYYYDDPSWPDKLTQIRTTGFDSNFNVYTRQFTPGYDTIGNPSNWRDSMSFDWTRGRRLSSITAPGSMFSYSYNDSGIRTSKTVNATTTNYTLSGSKIYRQTDGTNTLEFFYDESGQLLGFTTAGVKYWYVRNLQGDIIGIIDDSGNQVVSYSYDAWGNLLSTTGSLASTIGVLNPFRYRGYYFDSETGFYYLNSRYYDPEVGRFLNVDREISGVADDIRGYNAFIYCFNNPTNMSDENGYWPEWAHKLATAAVIVGVTAIVAVSAYGLATLCVTGGVLAASMVPGIVVGAIAGGLVSGAVSAFAQFKQGGWHNINLWAVGVDTFGGALSGALSGLLGGPRKLGTMAYNAIMGAAFSLADYLITTPEPSLTGVGIAIVTGATSSLIGMSPGSKVVVCALGVIYDIGANIADQSVVSPQNGAWKNKPNKTFGV
jgi:RHS repeat-associated protein